MKLLEQTRRTCQGTSLRDKVLPSHCWGYLFTENKHLTHNPKLERQQPGAQPGAQPAPERASLELGLPHSPWLLTNTLMATVPWPGPLLPVPLSLLPPLQPALCRSSRRSGVDLEHPEAGRHQPGKPVPWGGLRKEPDGGLAATQTMDWLQVHTQGLGPLLALQGGPDLLIPVYLGATSAQHTARQGKEVSHMRPGIPGGPAGQLHV